MKTIKLALIGLLAFGLSGMVNAQAKTMKKKEAVKQENKKKEAPASARHLKKDGTPDMRYKENKAAAGKKEAPKTAKTTGKESKAAPSTAKKAPHTRPAKKK